MRDTRDSQRFDWSCTTPSPLSSSHQLVWKGFMRTVPESSSPLSLRASSMRSRSFENSGRSRRIQVPLSSTISSSSRVSAAKRSANSTTSPSMLTCTARSNQSLRPVSCEPVVSVSVIVSEMSGSPVASRNSGASPETSTVT